MKQKRPSLFDDAGFDLNAFDVLIFNVKISPVHFHRKMIQRSAFSVISVYNVYFWVQKSKKQIAKFLQRSFLMTSKKFCTGKKTN